MQTDTQFSADLWRRRPMRKIILTIITLFTTLSISNITTADQNQVAGIATGGTSGGSNVDYLIFSSGSEAFLGCGTAQGLLAFLHCGFGIGLHAKYDPNEQNEVLTVPAIRIPINGTLTTMLVRNMNITNSDTPWTFTLIKNGVATSLTCTTNSLTCEDLFNSVTVAANDELYIDIEYTSIELSPGVFRNSGGVVSTVSFVFEISS